MKYDGLLKTVHQFGSFGVYAEGIVEAADMIRKGYAVAENDFEGPRLYLTDKGRAEAERLKLAEDTRTVLPRLTALQANHEQRTGDGNAG